MVKSAPEFVLLAATVRSGHAEDAECGALVVELTGVAYSGELALRASDGIGKDTANPAPLLQLAPAEDSGLTSSLPTGIVSQRATGNDEAGQVGRRPFRCAR